MHSKRMADLSWWCTQLGGAPLQPLLQSDYPRSGRANIGQNPGDIVKVATRLWARAANEEVRLSMPVSAYTQMKESHACSSYCVWNVLADFKLVLGQYSGQHDIVVRNPGCSSPHDSLL